MASVTQRTTRPTTQPAGRRTAPASARPRPADTCRLTLHIRGVAYSVRTVASPDGRAYRLRKADGTVHDVAETPHGPTCDCADQTFRHEGIDGRGCKHLRALRALGLIAGTADRSSNAGHRDDPAAESWPAWTDATRYGVAR